MLPAHALRPLLRYFDAVDDIVSAGMRTARPQMEVTLTSTLCELMDELEQRKYRLSKDLRWLRARLAERVATAELSFEIRTHEYPPNLEFAVTQSDLGVVIEFEDHLRPERDWVSVSLLQAKRLVRRKGLDFNGASTFGARDKSQEERIAALNKLLGTDLVRYLLYTPRPQVLAADVAAALRYRRDLNFNGPIFDYAGGLAVHRELTRKRRVVDGGILVGPPRPTPRRLDKVYDELFAGTVPWSWFLALTLIGWPPAGHYEADWVPKRYSPEELLAHPVSLTGVVTGDVETAAAVIDRLGGGDAADFPFLPSRSIRVGVTVGGDRQAVRDDAD